MKTLVLVIAGLFAGTAAAHEAAAVAAAATGVAGDGVQGPQPRAVGKINVNTATREQLLRVPGLEAASVDALLAARPVSDLAPFVLAPEARAHLKLSGDSTFFRILQGPLVRLAGKISASR